MDLLGQIEAQKKKLKATKMIVTNETGERYEISNGVEHKLTDKYLPFVIDDKPDMEIAEIIDGLFLSSQDPVTSEELLKKYGITNVLSLGVKILVQQKGINYYFVDFLDLPEFDISEVIETTLRIIHNCRKDNILVHCNAGVSRSASIVIAYLMAVENLNYDAAYERVKSKRNCIRPNDGFVKQLKNYSNLKGTIQNSVSNCSDETLRSSTC